MSEFEYLLYEKVEGNIARIWLNRPETKNAQDTKMLYELNDAYDLAIADEGVKVIILAAKGSDFSAGHDLREQNVRQAMRDIAYVVPRHPYLDEAHVIAHCAEHLANYKRPRRIIFRDELPKSNVGKILRKELLGVEQQECSQ